jgi:predicted sulfurtransferase
MTEHHTKVSPTDTHRRHEAVVLFYQYFPTSEFPILHRYASYFEEQLLSYFKKICQRWQMKGRVLISIEGVNGTLSAASMQHIDDFITTMQDFELLRDCGYGNVRGDRIVADDNKDDKVPPEFLFRHVDWKKSYSQSPRLPEPFPDLKVSIVKEIISSGGGVSVDEIPLYGGTHLNPQEFHRILQEQGDNVVLIDVRNTFECNIGHFVNPHTQEAAVNPEIVKFSMFDQTFCEKQAANLKNKKVLMYCTGGIRCEKASVMLKRRGVSDVSQLKGGIHKYLEEYGDKGFFQGRNFVFDQRIAMTPAECQNTSEATTNPTGYCVVGRCVSCETLFDELSGSRICTVCRDPLVVCPSCQDTLREYHCRRHAAWKSCYFTFLEVFSREQLICQRNELVAIRDGLDNKNMRRTLLRQVQKVDDRIRDLDKGIAVVDPNAPRRCRTCMESREQCDGLCWGFWKAGSQREATVSTPPLCSIEVGAIVEPGPNWNALRLGTPQKDSGGLRCGKVIEVKSWGSGGSDLDSVVVQWDEDSIPKNRRADRVPQIYRWGVVALDGRRMHDVQQIDKSSN